MDILMDGVILNIGNIVIIITDIFIIIVIIIDSM